MSNVSRRRTTRTIVNWQQMSANLHCTTFNNFSKCQMSENGKWQQQLLIDKCRQIYIEKKRQNRSNVTVHLQWLGIVKTTFNSCSQCQMSANGGWQLVDAQDGCKLRSKDFCCHAMRNPNGGGTNQQNAGWTSVDRSTKATLSTYNTWIQISRLQKIYLFHHLKLC